MHQLMCSGLIVAALAFCSGLECFVHQLPGHLLRCICLGGRCTFPQLATSPVGVDEEIVIRTQQVLSNCVQAQSSHMHPPLALG